MAKIAPGTQPRIGCFWGVNPPRPGEVRSELLSPLVPRQDQRAGCSGGEAQPCWPSAPRRTGGAPTGESVRRIQDRQTDDR